MRIRLAATLSLLVILSACGGGGAGSDGGGGGLEPRYAVSGTISTGADAAIDSDTGDPSIPRVANNTIATAQVIRNPITLGGYANEASDPDDVFRVDLAGGQVINLFIAEDGASNDLDLFLTDLGGNILVASRDTDKLESITVPGTGTGSYLVVVEVYNADANVGASNYVLSITQPGRGATTAYAPHGMSTQAEFVPDQAMVTYATDVGAVSAKSLGAAALASIPGRLDLLDLSATTAKALATDAGSEFQATDPEVAARMRTLLAIKSLRGRAGVKTAEPNLVRRAFALPNDQFLPQQWHYNLINLPQAWDVTTGSPSVLVAVADTGVRLAHPDLAGKFDPADPNGYDFVNDTRRSLDGDGRDGNADDPGDGGVGGGSSFHGTHVAGTIAAATDNSVGVAGAGWNTRIMPLRVLGEGGAGSSFDILNAVLYAARLPNASGTLPPVKASVINLSLGSDTASNGEAQAYADAVAAGLIVIAAAGNSGNSQVSYPASYPGVVSVAAVGRQKQRAPYSQFNSAVDVAAPGGDQSRAGADGVLSTLSSDSSGSIQDGLGYLQGTSMAAPHMAAVVALMKAVNPNLTPTQLDGLLAGGTITEDLGAAGRDSSFGYGLIDANKAVREALRIGGGGSVPDNPRLAVQPDSLSLGNSATTATLDVRNAGTGTLSVTGYTASTAWLRVAPQTVDATNQGRYVVTVNRTGLADGTYSGTVSFTSQVNTVTVPVLISVGAVSGNVDAGKQYVLLVDPDTLEAVDGDEITISNGRYVYNLSAPAGDYLLISGTDSDNDDFICDDGEACGGFPTLDSITPVNLTSAGRSGLDFLVSFDLSVPDTQGAAPAPRRGYRVPRGRTWDRPARRSARGVDEAQGHAIGLADRQVLVAILVAQAQGRRQGPDALGMVGGVLGVGVDLGLALELEAGRGGEFDHQGLGDVARGLHLLDRRAGPRAVLHHAQRPARLQRGVEGLEHLRLEAALEPVVDVAERQHQVRAAGRRRDPGAGQPELRDHRLAEGGGVGGEARLELLHHVDPPLRRLGAVGDEAGGDVLAGLAQVGRQHLGIPP